MKKFFQKAKQLEHGHLRELAGLAAAMMILIFAAVFVAGGGMAKVNHLLAVNGILSVSQKAGVVLVTIDQWYATPSPMPYNTSGSLFYSSTNANVCYFSGGWYGDTVSNNDSLNSTASYPGASCFIISGGINNGKRACGLYTQNADHGFVAPGTGNLTSDTTFYIRCENSGPTNTGDSGWVGMTATVATDNCPTPSTASGAGLLVGPGVHNVVGAGQDFCVNNKTGNTYFVSTISSADINSFKAAALGYLSGSVTYFDRTPGF